MPAQPPSYSSPDPRALAIIALSISAPGGETRGLDTEAFYEFLKNQRSGIITVPSNRWNADAFYGNAPGKICTTKGGFIPEFCVGDLQEFGITPAEAEHVAVAQTVLLHQAFNALQRSGIDYRGTNTGVFVGCAGGSYPVEMDITQAGAYYMTGSSLSIAANRISYIFDLLGQSLPVDTACSSSLTAMHLAMQAIRRGECDQAVVAGVNVVMALLETAAFSQLGVLSPDGISKSFDDEANGYARGDVASAVVIKRHDLCVKDNDRIYATLVGSALTSCGSIMGSLTTPNPHAQAQAIRNAYHDADLKPYQADFVELHGTGTVAGDSVEAEAAGSVFSEGRGGREIRIGSVKSNVGHGEVGAYMTSLIKVVMMLHRKQLLPNGYFNKPSSKIEFDKDHLRVPTAVEDFVPHDTEQGLIASISSYGFGGSCGHTVLREHESRPTHADKDALTRGPFLFAIGALTPKSLHAFVLRYRDEYSNTHPLALCEHLGSRARQMPWRTYAVSSSISTASFPDPVIVGKRPSPVVFCFSGQGPQHWQQGRDLMRMYAVFRNSIRACDKVYEEYTGTSFLAETGLFLSDAPDHLNLATKFLWPADVISVAITFFQIAMFDLLISFGIRPDAVIGHSIGETAVLYASGAMLRDMVVKIAVARGRALAKVDNLGGAMVAISGCSKTALQGHIEAVAFLCTQSGLNANNLHIATFNSSAEFGVSGPEAEVDLLKKYLDTWIDGVIARKLRVSTAVHSLFVDPCETSYRLELATIFAQYTGPFVPTLNTMSTVSSNFKTDGYTIEYLWWNLRQPVLFSSAIQALVEKYGEHVTLLEISPHPVLSQINFSILNGCPSENVDGPAYPFQLKVIPFAPSVPSYLSRLLPRTRILNSSRLRISPQLPEIWMSHHVIDHSNLIPAAAYLEMALEFPGVTQVWDCRFEAACILEDSVAPVTLEVARDGISWSVNSSSALQTLQGDLEWTRATPLFDTTHACGKIGYGKPRLNSRNISQVDVAAVLARCWRTIHKDEIYEDIQVFVQFGDEFKRLNKASINETEAVCWIRGHVDGVNKTDYQFHPALMDAVFQSLLAWNQLYNRINTGKKDRVFLLPHSLRRGFRNDGSSEPLILPEEFRTYTILRECSPHHWLVDTYVLDHSGTVLFTFEDLFFKVVEQDEQWPKQRYMMYWQPRALPRTELGNHVLLEGLPACAVHLLSSLDQLALAYVKDMLRSLPDEYDVGSPDRRRYLEWARALVQEQLLLPHPEQTVTIQNEYQTECHSLFELTECVGKGQKDILSSSAAAVALLFHDDLMTKVYELPPFTGPVFEKLTEVFIALVKCAIRAEKRVVRVLEVGAGTGKLTVLLGKALIEAGIDKLCFVDYVSTDVAVHLAQQSATRSPWPTITAATFDLNCPLDGQGLDPMSFDIVVAFDILHAIPDVQGTLGTLRDLLLPGGHLAVIELDGRSFVEKAVGTIWMNFVFGAFAEWTGVLDKRPDTLHCSLTPDNWNAALTKTGFNDVLLLTSSPHSVSHIAFVAQLPPTVPASSPMLSPSLRQKPLTPHVPDQKCREIDADVATSTTCIINDVSCEKLDNLNLPSLHDGGTADISSLRLSSVADASDAETILVHDFSSGREVELVELLSTLDSKTFRSVWLHTDTQPVNAGLIGITRTIRHEFDLWRIVLVIFHPSWNMPRRETFIWRELMPLKWVDPELLVDEDGNIRVPRVVLAPATPPLEPRGDHPIAFNRDHIWRAYPPCLGAEDVEVKVSYISLSPTFLNSSEFAGEVTAVGIKVADADLLGRRVFGVAPMTTGSIIVCKRSQIETIPDGMNDSMAAAIAGPLAFLSSVVTPEISATSHSEPRILIHLGHSPPAAIATLMYLKALSMDIVATIDEPSSDVASDAYVRTQMHPSKPCDVWSFYIRETGSKSVDIAFNFDLDPDTTKETVRLLSSRGTLVQIGSELPLCLRRGCRYISVDYRDVLDANGLMQVAVSRISPSLMIDIASPTTIFSPSNLSEAQERADVVAPGGPTTLLDLQHADPDLPILRGGILRNTAAFDPRATYVIVGGVGGLGADIANCLVENGATHVILTSRSGANAFRPKNLIREKQIISHLQGKPGVTVDILAIDCLDVDKTKALFSAPQRRIAGVFYLAVHLNDQVFTNLTTEQDWTAVSDIKVQGVNVLLQAVNPKDLDFLVLTSSVATVTGSPGQATYTAAQAEMEAMGSLLPNTISVAVPPIVDGGVFVRSMPAGGTRSVAVEKYKYLGVTGRQVAAYCVDAIWSLSSTERYSVYIPPLEWKKVADMSSPKHSFSLRHLVVKEVQETGVSETDKKSIRATCAAVLSLELDDVEENVPLGSYGLDSLTSVRLSGILKQNFGITVTQLQLLSRHMTVERLQAIQEEQRLADQEDCSEAAINAIDEDRLEYQLTRDDADKTVVRLNSAAEGKPLFIFHGAGGGILVLQKMAQGLHFPVFGVQDTQEAPITGTLEQLAEFYLSKIFQVQQSGPYRLCGFSFGTCLALVTAQMLQTSGETVEVIVMLDGAPNIYQRPEFATKTVTKILDGTLRFNIMNLINDMVSSGTLDGASDIAHQFSVHFEEVEAGGSPSAKWVARFCRAYVAHVLMGLRKSRDMAQRMNGAAKELIWPTERTILVRAKNGLCAEPAAQGTSAFLDLDLWASDIQLYELPGTHFGILNPLSGLVQILNEVL